MAFRQQLRRWSLLISFGALSFYPASAQNVTISPISLSFGNQAEGTVSASKKVTLKNGQKSAITITSIATNLPDYVTTNTCPMSPATLAASASCTVSVSFEPTALASRSAVLTISDTGASNPQLVTLSGTGTAPTLVSIAVTPTASSISVSGTQQFVATGTYSNGSTQLLTSTAKWTSSTASVATVKNTGLATGVSAGISTIKAASGTITGSTALTVTAATLTSIAIAPASPSIAAGKTEQFTATGTYSNGTTKNLTTTSIWTSSATSVAAIGSGGLATGATAGTTTITATSGTISGSTALTVTGATLSSISLTPAAPSIALGITQQFTATGKYSDGSSQDLTGTATWTSSANTVATVTAAGLATGIAKGSTTITAKSGTISASTSLKVTSAVLTSLAVTPSPATIAVGATQQFLATGTYSDGSTQNLTSTAKWSSSATSVATVKSTTGLGTGVAAGATTITATSGIVSGSATLTVTSAVLTSISVTPTRPSVVSGRTQQLTATGTYSNGSTQNLTTTVTWSSSAASVASVSSVGLGTGVSPGTAIITATSGTITGSVTLTVTAAVLNSLSVTPASVSLAKGSGQQLTATGTYSDGTTQVLTATVVWASSANSVASVSGTGLVTANGVGIDSITASSGSISATASVNVGQASLVSIALTPVNPTLALGTTLPLAATGTYTDGSTLDLTTAATWTSAAPSIATLNDEGVATAVGLGSVTVTATSGSVAGSTALTITAATLVSIAVTPAIPSIPLGTTQQFGATGTYTDGSTQNITPNVQWNSDAPAVAALNSDPSLPGLVNSVGRGSATIRASLGSASGSTVLNVTSAILVSLTVSPPNPSIALGTVQQFTVSGTFSDGSSQDLTGAVTWSSDTPATAVVNNVGSATSTGLGTTTIAAASGAITGSTVLTVTTAALVSIAITPPFATAPLGTAPQFTGTGTFTDGTSQDLTQSGHWTSTAPNVATISNSAGTAGLANALGTGITIIGISSSTVSASATLTVSPAALASITISPQTPTISLGTTQQFAATGIYTDGSSQDVTSLATWSSTDATIAIISNSLGSYGLATSAGLGTTNIAATAGSLVASTACTVGQASLTSIAVTPSNTAIALGYLQQFAAVATYSDGSTQDITQSVIWISSSPSVATISTAGVAMGTSAGTAQISATSGSVTGATSITVNAPVPLSLSISPANPSISVGGTQQFVATLLYSDGTSLDVTNTAAWTSSAPTIAGISGFGLGTGIAAGSSSVQAQWGTGSGAIAGTATLTVLASGVSVIPATSSIAISGTQQFVATISGGGGQDVTWSVDGVPGGNPSGIGTISANGFYAAPSTVGTHTVTATSQANSSSSGSATLTVTSPVGGILASPYFGIDYNTAMPIGSNAISHGIGRFWDTPGVTWPFVQTSACTVAPCSGSFTWTTVDSLLSQMLNGSIRTAQVALSRTPSFATSNPSDLKCAYAKQGGIGNSSPGQCDPPTDLNSDGTGTNQYWRDWVAAYVSHVNAPGYTSTHARVAYWEIWNEPDARTFWTGTMDQLIRMQEDAYCIIKGGSFTIRATGESCTQVQSAVKSASLTGPIDPTALVLMPSYHAQPDGLPVAQAFLYCTGSSIGSSCHNGGHSTTDVVNFHTKPGSNYPSTLESVMDLWTSGINGILQPAEALKPLFGTEGGYATSGWVAPYTVDLNQAAYIARFYIYLYYKGYANNVWYDYTALNGLGSTAANNAYSQIYGAMVGATSLACSVTANGTADVAQPSLYTCTFIEADGTPAQWMWDTDNSGQPAFWDTGASNNLECHSATCPTLIQPVPNSMLTYVDITGAKATLTGHLAPVGIRPILVQAKQ
jgi:trimeric autotransporter adhesin